ncbi:MAG: Cysteine desulfurase IscS [Hyphomicrobiaceae bacterium hypho_1]
MYMDYNAAAPLRPEVRSAMSSALDTCGNFFSKHNDRRVSRRIIEQAREQVATLVSLDKENVPGLVGFGAACSSWRVESSHALSAMGVSN